MALVGVGAEAMEDIPTSLRIREGSSTSPASRLHDAYPHLTLDSGAAFMTTTLTIVATIQAQPGHEAEIGAAFLALIEPTLAETGCLQYDLHRDLEVPGRLLFYENWASREDWEAHNASAHITALGAATKGKLGAVEILQMEQIRP
jgi:quinol monooxygenase YgiN